MLKLKPTESGSWLNKEVQKETFKEEEKNGLQDVKSEWLGKWRCHLYSLRERQGDELPAHVLCEINILNTEISISQA